MNYYPQPNITRRRRATTTRSTFQGPRTRRRYPRATTAASARRQRAGAWRRRRPRRRGRCKRPESQRCLRRCGRASRRTLRTRTRPARMRASRRCWAESRTATGTACPAPYTVGYGRINSTATLGWNRSRAIASNYFTNGTGRTRLRRRHVCGQSDCLQQPVLLWRAVGRHDQGGCAGSAMRRRAIR
jgi:hypothetical protein